MHARGLQAVRIRLPDTVLFSDVPCWRRGYRLARPLPARQGLTTSGAMGVAFYVP